MSVWWTSRIGHIRNWLKPCAPRIGGSKPCTPDFEKKEVPVFYGTEGPGALYQRAGWTGVSEPELAALQEDDGRLNFWAGLDAAKP